MAEFARCFVKWAFAFNSPRNSWWFDVVSTHIKSMCSALPLMMISSCFFWGIHGSTWLNHIDQFDVPCGFFSMLSRHVSAEEAFEERHGYLGQSLKRVGRKRWLAMAPQ
jgi:hypothetical protein